VVPALRRYTPLISEVLSMSGSTNSGVEPVRSRAREDAGRTTQKAPGERLELST
jgi:hypothetical protein